MLGLGLWHVFFEGYNNTQQGQSQCVLRSLCRRTHGKADNGVGKEKHPIDKQPKHCPCKWRQIVSMAQELLHRLTSLLRPYYSQQVAIPALILGVNI